LILKCFRKMRNDHSIPTVPKPCRNSDAHRRPCQIPRPSFQWFRLSASVAEWPETGNSDSSIQLRYFTQLQSIDSLERDAFSAHLLSKQDLNDCSGYALV
jgi:hypothetical protein